MKLKPILKIIIILVVAFLLNSLSLFMLLPLREWLITNIPWYIGIFISVVIGFSLYKLSSKN